MERQEMIRNKLRELEYLIRTVLLTDAECLKIAREMNDLKSDYYSITEIYGELSA